MVYLLAGENTYEAERRLKELVAQFGGDVERVDGSELTSEQLPDLLAGVTLFSSDRHIVIKNASQNKPVWTALGEWFERGVDTDIVLVEKSPDRRTKTYKWLEKHATFFECKELPQAELEKWFVAAAKHRELVMPPVLARFVIEYVGTDQWQLSHVLEKIQLSNRTPDEALIRELIEPTPQATSFEVLDAAFSGDTSRLERLLETVMDDSDPYQFFGLLASQVYALALIHAGADKPRDAVAKAGNIHPFVISKLTPIARRLSRGSLQTLATRLGELDANMKLLATPPWLQLRVFLLSLKDM